MENIRNLLSMENIRKLLALLILFCGHGYVSSQEHFFSSEHPILSEIRYDNFSPEAIQKREKFLEKIKEETDKRYNFTSTISWNNFVAESYDGGDGTPEDPYQIAKPEQLVLLAQQTNDGTGGDACYILTNDIDLEGNIGYNWTPIGDTIPFTGVFDGNNHTISNMYVVERLGYSGLFGSTENATIKNIIMDNAYIQFTIFTGTEYALIGVVVAYAVDTDISNCRISGDVVSIADFAGGVAGIVGGIGDQNDTIFIKDCVNHAKIFNAYQVGGIVGITYKENGNIIIQNCENYGELESSSMVGGIVAESGSGCIIRGCDNYGIIVDGVCCGGILGQVNEWALVEDCINHESAEIHGNAAGGIVGAALSGTIKRCGNRGLVDVFASGSFLAAGGIASSDGNFFSCYNTGTVRGEYSMYPNPVNAQMGGITGAPAHSIHNVYNAGEIIEPTDTDIDSEFYEHISPAIRSINTVSDCFWYGNEDLSDVVFDMGTSSYVQMPASSRFFEGTTATSWILGEPQYGVDDLLEVLNAGTMGSDDEYVWREDVNNENKGFPIIERIIYDDIKEVNEDAMQVSIYPNPSSDFVKLSAVGCQLSMVRIFNGIGVLVSEMNINSDEAEIDVSNYRSGIYFIHVYSDDKVSCSKIVKL